MAKKKAKKKTTHGGKRKGSGRKKIGRTGIVYFRTSQDVKDWLDDKAAELDKNDKPIGLRGVIEPLILAAIEDERA